MRLRATATARLVVAGVLFGLAGCGGTDSIFKQEFAKRVTERCKQYVDDRKPYEAKLAKIGNPATLSSTQLKAASPDIVGFDSVVRNSINDIKALPDVEDADPRLDDKLVGYDIALNALDRVDSAAKAGDGKATLAAFRDLEEELNKTHGLTGYGFEACD